NGAPVRGPRLRTADRAGRPLGSRGRSARDTGGPARLSRHGGGFVTFEDKVRLLSDLYGAFSRREIDRVLSALDPSVRWPNVLEKSELRGHAAVRAYWLGQFAPTKTP